MGLMPDGVGLMPDDSLWTALCSASHNSDCSQYSVHTHRSQLLPQHWPSTGSSGFCLPSRRGQMGLTGASSLIAEDVTCDGIGREELARFEKTLGRRETANEKHRIVETRACEKSFHVRHCFEPRHLVLPNLHIRRFLLFSLYVDI